MALPRNLDLAGSIDLPSTVRRPYPLNEEQEENPKTISLKKLVKRIEPGPLVYYLQEISVFLKKKLDKNELRFPLIKPEIDAFLVRVMRDEQNLEGLLDLLDNESQKLSLEILEILKRNEGVYELVHNYDTSRSAQSVLSFRKIRKKKYEPESSTQNPWANLSEASRSTEVAIMTEEPQDKELELPVTLKAQWYEATVRFVKDTTVESLKYPEMSIEEAEYVYGIIRSPLEGKNSKGALVEHIKALNAMNLDFKVSFMYMPHDKIRLLVEKVPLNNNKTPEKSQDTTKFQKNFNNKRQLIQNLSETDPDFARTALRMTLDFVETIDENTLAFKNANDDHTLFLQSVASFAKNRRMHSLFDEECQVLLRKIGRVLTEKCRFDMGIEVSKMDKETRRRKVSLLKHPKGIFKKEEIAFTKASDASMSADGPATKPQKPPIPAHTQPLTSIQAKSQSKDNVQDIETFSAENKNKTTDNTKKENIKPTDNTGVRTYRKPARNVTDNKPTEAGVTDNMIYRTIDNSKPDSNTNTTDGNRNEQLELRTQSDGRPLPFRKAKLLDAMAVPVESERASRIMRQMGWDGGPLGARGEGITEPIVPALHMTAGAGLGHVKPKKEVTAAAVKYLNFRLDLLKHFHSLILEEPLKRTVLYNNQLCKKERAFLNLAVKCLNTRKGVYLNDEALQDTVYPLLEEMACEPKLQVYAVVSEDKRAIILAKNSVPTSKPPPPVQPSPAPTPESVLSFVAKHARSSFISMEAITKLGKDLMPGHAIKSAKSLGHRVVMLARIYELVNSVAVQKVLTFEQSLTCKQVSYINEVVSSFNCRSKLTYCTAYENFIAVETLKVAGDDFLVVILAENHMSLTIKKKYHLKRKNIAKDVEVATTIQNKNVIPKELKTTVIDNKINEKVTPKAEKCNNSVVDDDDVIFIPSEDGNIIEISSESDLTDSEDQEITKCSKKKAKDLVIRNKGACSVEPENLNIEEFEKIKLDDEEESDLVKDEEQIEKEHAADKDQNKENEEALNKDDENNSGLIKRSRTDSIESTQINKKTKLLLPKYLCIAPDSYPIEEVTADIIRSFQTRICNKIDEITEKPLIECIGLKNGALIYGCHNDIGISLIEGIAHEINLQTTNITKLYVNRKRYKLTARINSYLDINLKKVFTHLEEYNFGLKTDSWTITEVQKNTDCVEMMLEVDGFSYEYIAQSCFSLFLGMDNIKFCITWD